MVSFFNKKEPFFSKIENISFSKGLVKIEGEVSGLKSGNHGFHVHEKGDLTQV